MLDLHATDAPALVAAAFAFAACACGVTGWVTGSTKVLRRSATYRQQNVGLVIACLGSIGFIGGMTGVRYADGISALLLTVIH